MRRRPALMIAAVLIVVAAATAAVMYTLHTSAQDAAKETERLEKERLEMEAAMLDRIEYIWNMNFVSNVGFGGDILIAMADGNYTAFAFVHSEDLSKGYGDNVIVAWPAKETEIALARLNDHIEHFGIDLTPYSLSFPITKEDTVDKWEEVNRFINNELDSSQRFFLLSSSDKY
jgi:hypothetical protein